jgi:hypothetical protein
MRILPISALLFCACASTRDVRSDGADPSTASLALLKKLEGTWVAVDEHGKPTDQVSNVFHVTAGGSAVQEVVFPGTEHEMITLYYVQDGRLQLTHYCMKGNQPHMLAQPTQDERELEFRCDGTGVASEDEGHMHHARFRLADDGRLSSRWQFVEQGKETHLADFMLVRKAK